MKKKKRISMIVFCLLLTTLISYGSQQVVVTLGNDLNQQQRKQMLELFGVEEGSIKILVVTNQEERTYLEGLATERQIGTRAISSAYIEDLQQGEGISVETYNITWVTEEMIMNALVTAGVTNAKVVAASPFEVSGTAALTGILKGFEEITGEAISEEQKQVANEEMIKTAELGEKIGKDEASTLIREIKEVIVEKRIREPEEIKRVVIEIAGQLNIRLTEGQIEEITKLMEGITRLNLNTEVIRQQLHGIGRQLRDISRENQQVQSFLQRIIEMLRSIVESILGIFSS
ncbi:DUF1002 domain-containing protein [Clostridium formicaceticum]|uniref:DUF1002 domain-containing protein n=1 Tax=Clostridium formicaceticum TaxID=1497 RepID=A0AAC9RM11_9CLOT|nr:DUF1002 domain-containing protein [Clostridium formicaceticum]AOY75130.1 hypothetical protein BJL90_03950 [Clostridium formicaceticum]ARE89554.1 hypothetical protein CLFO_40320 [Clostridium formicaceticum]